MAEKNTEDTPFNMAMLYYMHLHKLRMHKSRAVLEDNINMYFDCLEEIYINISFKIKNKDINHNVTEKFKKAKKNLVGGQRSRIGEQISTLQKKKAKEILREIDVILLQQMHNHNMIFPKIETSAGLDGLDKRYGL